LRGPEQYSSAAGTLPSQSSAAPTPFYRAVDCTRYVILLVIGSVLFAALAIWLFAPALTT
jgi:hypothetical protein